MKSSIHLLYGIIIGILLVACTGSIKGDMAEFEEEKIVGQAGQSFNDLMKELKKDGWTIIDWEINRHGHNEFHIGK